MIKEIFKLFGKRKLKSNRDPFLIDEKPQELLSTMPDGNRYSLPGLVSEVEEVVRNLERIDRELHKLTTLEEARHVQTMRGKAERKPAVDTDPSTNAKVLSTIKNFLSVVDGLDNILNSTQHLLEENQQNDEMSRVIKNLIEAVRIVHQKGIKTLGDLNVREIKTVGENFNPNLHVAIDTTADPNLPPLVITDVESKGYLYGDVVLRPAHVIVNKVEENGI